MSKRKPAVVDDPEVRAFLCLSTAHLPPEIGTNYGDIPGCTVAHYPEGMFMWVPNSPKDSDTLPTGVPPELLRIQLYARKHDCDYVQFDADGPRNAALPTWDW